MPYCSFCGYLIKKEDVKDAVAFRIKGSITPRELYFHNLQCFELYIQALKNRVEALESEFQRILLERGMRK